MERPEPDHEDPLDEDWETCLTPELRRLFERTGRYLVEQKVLTGLYEKREKRMAVLVWLGEKREKDRRGEIRIRFLTLAVAVFAAFGGALLGAGINAASQRDLQVHQADQERAALIQTLSADVKILKDEENMRFSNLKPMMQRLVEKDQADEGGRPWLMAPVPLRFPVFENNAGRLGLLASSLPEKVAKFYGLSYSLRSHINTVISPAMIFASKPDKEFAVGEYEKQLRNWNVSADDLIIELGN